MRKKKAEGKKGRGGSRKNKEKEEEKAKKKEVSQRPTLWRCFPAEFFDLLSQSILPHFSDRLAIALDFSGGYATSVISGMKNSVLWGASYLGCNPAYHTYG